MSETKAERLSKLADDIDLALGQGEFPENKLRRFRFLWGITPNQEKDGLSLTLKDIEEMIASFRRETSLSTTGKVRRFSVKHVQCDC